MQNQNTQELIEEEEQQQVLTTKNDRLWFSLWSLQVFKKKMC